MNCGSLSDRHKYPPHRRIHIEIFHFVSLFATVSLSNIRENLLKMRNVGNIYIYICMEIVWPCCVITVDVWVSRRYEFPRALHVFMEIQKFLVRCCCNESPRTLVPFCIFLSHLRTRRCVILIWVSRYGFPRVLLKNHTFLTKCSESVGCIWTQHSRRTCFRLRNQV